MENLSKKITDLAFRDTGLYCLKEMDLNCANNKVSEKEFD